jgi:hypothetical protein
MQASTDGRSAACGYPLCCLNRYSRNGQLYGHWHRAFISGDAFAWPGLRKLDCFAVQSKLCARAAIFHDLSCPERSQIVKCPSTTAPPVHHVLVSAYRINIYGFQTSLGCQHISTSTTWGDIFARAVKRDSREAHGQGC